MRSSRTNLQGLLAASALMMAASGIPSEAMSQLAMPRPPKRRYYQPSMKTAQDREIAEWNAAVEAKRQAKKGRRGE